MIFPERQKRFSVRNYFRVAAIVCMILLSADYSLTHESQHHKKSPFHKFQHPNSITVHPNSNHLQELLTVYPDHVPTQTGNVTIAWKGIEGVTVEDWIGVFTPPNETRVYLAQWVNQSVLGGDLWAHGVGQLDAFIINMRQDYAVRYYRGLGKNETVIAVANPLTVDANYPMHGHLSYTRNPDEMRVMWVSNSSATSTVRYGLDPQNLNLIATGSTHTYFASDLCFPKNKSHYWAGGHLWWEPGQIHDVLLSELKLNTRYYYKYGSDSSGYSNTFSFRSHIGVGNEAAASTNGVRVIAFGDMGASFCPASWGCIKGSGLTAHTILQEIASDDYAMVLHIGDISYALNYGVTWEEWFDEIEPIATQVPWMVGLGNHEYDHFNQPFKPDWGNYGNDSNGECGVPYRNRFHMPSGLPTNKENSNRAEDGNFPPIDDTWWYSFDYGNIHWVMMSSEHDFTPGSQQYQWIENDLASVNRTLTPWLIFNGHRPMYCSGDYPSDYQVALNLQFYLEDLLYKYQVDLALWGHYHSYERTCPVYRNRCVQENMQKNKHYQDKSNYLAPVHVVVGMAGAILSPAWMNPQPEWSLFRDGVRYGYSTVTIHNATALEFKYLEDTTAAVMDTFWLFK